MKFKYKAQKADGSFYEGARDAADKFALSRELRGEGETLISAFEVSVRGGAKGAGIRNMFPFLGRISFHEKIIFIRNLAGMLAAGLSVSRSLGVLLRQTHSPRFKKIIAGFADNISGGKSLSQALAEYRDVFPPIVISMVKAGEEGGNLSISLFAVADQLDKTYSLERKVRGAFMYPAIVIAVMILVGVVMFVSVVPKLTGTFKEFGVELPISTKIVIAVSDFLQARLIIGIGLAAGFLGGLWAAAKSARGKRFIDFSLLHIPVITPIIREAAAARIGHTLSSLLSSGVEVTTALMITADVLPNVYFRDILLLARRAIEKGEPMSDIFREHEDIFPPLLSEMVGVGEETGKLSGMLKETGAFFEAEVEQKTKNISVFIEPVLMLVVGVVVGFFAVAMISPAYSLMNSI